ncbi:MAG TPA: BamA/TamA family outer membrane protein, partial [Haliangiales bacterium]|nr:BamA/TamA family outer membrane protein [Haliangiales bacterium]
MSYSTDTGLGLGAIGSLARIDAGTLPFLLRIEAQLVTSIKEAPGGGLELVTHDDYVVADVPGLWDGRVRLRGRVGFYRAINAGYYGVGNAATPDPDKAAANPRYNQVEIVQVRVEPGARIRVHDALELLVVGRVGATAVGVYPGSELDEDRAGLRGVGDNGEVGATVGLVWDTRDHEAWPHRGVLADASARAGAGLGEGFGYGGATVAARAFVPVTDGVTLAARIVADAQGGAPPFYELVRVGGLGEQDATGGGGSLRGVPGQRYRGRVKLLGGVELRGRLPEWRIGYERFHVGRDHPVVAGNLVELAQLALAERRAADAVAMAERGMSLYEAAFGPTREESVEARGAYTRALLAAGQAARALAAAAPAVDAAASLEPEFRVAARFDL